MSSSSRSGVGCLARDWNSLYWASIFMVMASIQAIILSVSGLLLPLQQKMISWRYHDKCEVHCLTLEACNIYMLVDRKYPLSKDACQVMLKMKLLDGKMNEVCYKLLKMIEKQAGVKK
ncbi:hypothetical protein Tco_1417061 [Tanacetum coccineum]